MEREKFEESLKNAFENEEIAPSDNVWTNIELDLEKERGGQLKRRLLFYQMLAAASVVFAMAIGGIGYYNAISSGRAGQGNMAVNTPGNSDPRTSGSGAQTPQNIAGENSKNTEQALTDAGQMSIGSKDDIRTALEKADRDNRPAKSEVPDQPQTFVVALTDDSDIRNELLPDAANGSGRATRDANRALLLAIDDHNLSPLYSTKEIKPKLPGQKHQVDPVLAMLARLDQREKEVQGLGEEKNKSRKDRESENENLWTSIGFAAGSFSSVQSSVSGSSSRMQRVMVATGPTMEEETKASGYSYSLGVHVGTKLSEKWVFQGGVNYLTHASQYTASNVVASGGDLQHQRFRAASSNDVLYFDSQEMNTKIVYTAPYDVNNSMRYLSIPMQAGYLIVNKTLGLQLNAGVATDLFLQNTVTADSDQLDKTSQSGGSDSPYRSVNLSGLFGTEVSYRFGEHYRVSLNPGIRYPFNTIYKSEFGLQSTPLTFDVGLRFRYIFH